MNVEIDGKLVRLEPQQVIGMGGEGTVFLAPVAGQQMAVKVYHAPTRQRQEKLFAFLSRQWNLPQNRVALPLQIVREASSGDVIGLTMPYLDSGFEEIAQLANKKHQAHFQLTAKHVAGIFLDGAQTLTAIHRNGLLVGDLNDRNILYRRDTLLWIDVDAWQFSSYPCPVATEDFLVPELYGIDLSARAVFKPAHDWYAFAVHLFRSLLLAHPYGGTHKAFPLLTQRAQQHIFVLNADVTYPRIAYTPDLLHDDLLAVFERIFADGWRGPFPVNVLQNYYDSLVACPSCAMHYPRTRGMCPLCKTRTVVVMQQPLVSLHGVQATTLLHTAGNIVFSKVQGETLYVLASEYGSIVLYSKQPGLAAMRKTLFKEIPGTRYDLAGTVLISNAPGTAHLQFIDVAGMQPSTLFQAETAMFAGRRQAVFGTSETHVFSIINNALMQSMIEDGALSGRPLRTVMEKQSWFTVAPSNNGGKASVFGFFQVFRQQMYWLVRGRAVYDVALPTLEAEETLVDIAAYFSHQGVLVRRQTQERGIDYLRTEMIDDAGKLTYSAPRIKRGDHPCPQLHGLVYASGMLLHATDQGIVQEKVAQGTFKTFSATRDYVYEDDTLTLYQAGLLITGENQVQYLVM